MVTVGVVVLLVVGVLGADLVLENSGHTDVMIMGQSLSFDIWGLFLLGLAAGVLAVAGVHLLGYGVARDHQRRKIQRQRDRELAAVTRPAPAPAPTPTAPTTVARTAPTDSAPTSTAPVASAVAPAAVPRGAAARATTSAGASAADVPSTSKPAGSPPPAAVTEPLDAAAADKRPVTATARERRITPASDQSERSGVRVAKVRDPGSRPTSPNDTRTGNSADGGRSAVRVPTPPRSDARLADSAASPRAASHPRRGDRIVARVADLRRRGDGGEADD
ncbi:hypothetical protein MXD58_016775, partial [Frankia sp. AgKG'84/4]|nr:hypothetical protein [Frankia sp. AgKG'84/4]